MNGNGKTNQKIRVLIVDDSAFMRTALSRMIASEPEFEVAGTASSGMEAMVRIPALDPDVVTLDIQMPGLDGLQTLRRIMAESPRPVIMVSASIDKEAETTFIALGAGAFDYIPKQLATNTLDILHIREELLAKIKSAAASGAPSTSAPRKPPRPASIEPRPSDATVAPAVVAIGTSTGGPKALQEILPLLPADLGVPILIVQHMPPGFTAPFARRLDAVSSISVREANDREAIQPGVAYIAPAGTHMTVRRSDAGWSLSLDAEPADLLHIPSVDVMMQSVAQVFKNLAMGVILTGMGSDGAEGMKSIFRMGGLTIGQDEADCTVYGMPRACAEAGILTRVVPLLQVPSQILLATRYRRRA